MNRSYSRAWLVALIVLASATTWAGAAAQPDTSAAPPSAAIYDPDPNHLWNRLFVVFYRQKIATNSYDRFMVGWGRNQVGEPQWFGPDVLDPPIGNHPKFLLEDEPFARCNALLDEFISQRGATLIRDPLKRALLQRDLWAVFDVLAEADQQTTEPFPNSAEFFNRLPRSAALEEHRATLERKLAQVIRSLALSRAQIEKLPDTYDAAIRSGAFSNVLETNRYDFLPHDLFLADSGWHEVLPSHTFWDGEPVIANLLEHTLVVGGRSVFRTFVKLPEDPTTTTLLDSYAAENTREIRENNRLRVEWQQFWSTNTIARSNVLALAIKPEAWKQFALTNPESAKRLNSKTYLEAEKERKQEEWEHFWATNSISLSNFLVLTTNIEAWPEFVRTNREGLGFLRHLNPEPPRTLRLSRGMQFVLLREMICLDENGQMIPTHMVESVQFRSASYIDRSGEERPLFREAELSRALLFQGKQGGLRAIPRAEPRASFYNNLGHLRVDEKGNGPSHQPFPKNCGLCHTVNGLVSSVAQFSPPHRTVSIEPIAQWKLAHGKLDLLRQLMASDGK